MNVHRSFGAFQHSRRLVEAANLRHRDITHDDLWRAAACDYLESCFIRAPHEITRELANVFARVNLGYRPV